MRMIAIDQGPIWRMELLQALLAERGVPSFVPDSHLKLIDPFLTASQALDARLEVGEEYLERARVAVVEAREEVATMRAKVKAEREDEQAHSALDTEPTLNDDQTKPPVEALFESPPIVSNGLERLGVRLRWALNHVWLHPFALVYGARYLTLSMRGATGPKDHHRNLSSIVALMALRMALAFVAVKLWA